MKESTATIAAECVVPTDDGELPGTVDLPDGPVRAAVVVVHGSAAGHRSYFCYTHVGRVLTAHGVAVLRYDRRAPLEPGRDVPLRLQAADAAAAARTVRELVGGDVRLGLWGLSQGAWAAPMAAAHHPELFAFQILVSSCGVSPAAQMRHGTAEQLRRDGYGDTELAGLAELRAGWEAYQRGQLDRRTAQVLVDRHADRPWFPQAYVPRELPAAGGGWRDMDLDPTGIFAGVRCPTLLFYGETDSWMPIDDSIAAWRRSSAAELTVHRVAGHDHLLMREGSVVDPAVGDSPAAATAISQQYADLMADWPRLGR